MASPWLLFVQPGLGLTRYARSEALRTHLTLGSLMAALEDRDFVRRLAGLTGRADPPAFRVRLADLNRRPAGQGLGEYLAQVLKSEPDPPLALAVTATSGQLAEAAAVAQACADLCPTALRLIGGPHVSAAAEDYLDQTEFQAAGLGQGVETLVDLALELASAGPDLRRVAGLALKDPAGRVIFTPPRLFLLPLDDYPWPSQSLGHFIPDLSDHTANATEIAYLLAGQGCPFDCAFCAQRAVSGGRVRERRAASLLQEAKNLRRWGFRRFALVQESFARNRPRLARFVELAAESGLEIEWTMEARADQLDPAELPGLKAAGLRFIQLGLESGDQALLDRIDKRLDLGQAGRLLEAGRALGIDAALYLLVGLPGQDWISVLRTAEFLRAHPPLNRATGHASVAVAVPYPGTRLAQEGSVRLLGRPGLDWPTRTPEADFDDQGRLVGPSLTETAAMTGPEIGEAFFILDNLAQFLLHGLDDPALDQAGRAWALGWAARLHHLLQRRAARERVIQAEPGLTEARRRAALAELDQVDEERPGEIMAGFDPAQPDLAEFLVSVRLGGGFRAWREISGAERWRGFVRLERLWRESGRSFDEVALDSPAALFNDPAGWSSRQVGRRLLLTSRAG